MPRISHHSHRLLFLVTLLLACVTTISAQTAESDSLFSQGRSLYLAGNYDEALKKFTAMFQLDRASLPYTDEVIGIDKHWIAACHYKKGDVDTARNLDPNCFDLEPVDRIVSAKAIEYSRNRGKASSIEMAAYWASRCLEEELQNLGPDHFYVFGSYCILAELNYQEGDLIECRKYISLAKEIESKYSDSGSSGWRATVYGLEMDLEAAIGNEAPFRQALAKAWQMLDGDIKANPYTYMDCLQYILTFNPLSFSTAQLNSVVSATQASLLTILPEDYTAYLDLIRVINNYCITSIQPRLAITMTEEYLKKVPESDDNYDVLLCDLGRLYSVAGEHDKGIKTLKHGFALARDRYPSDPARWVEYYTILGQAYDNAHLYNESMDMYEQGAQTLKKLGPDYVSAYIKTFHARATICSRTANFPEALGYLTSCMKEMEWTGIGTITDKAYILKELGYCSSFSDSVKALDYFRQARAIYEAEGLTTDNDTYNECRIYELRLTRNDDWKPVIDTLCALCQDGSVMSHRRKIDLLLNYAGRLGEKYRMSDALPIIEQADSTARLFPDIDRTSILQAKAVVLASLGRFDDATEIGRSLYDSTSATYGKLSLQHASAISFLILLSDRTMSEVVIQSYPTLAAELWEFTQTLSPSDPTYLNYATTATKAWAIVDPEKALSIATSAAECVPQRVLDSNAEYASMLFSCISALERKMGNTDKAVTYASHLIDYIPHITGTVAKAMIYDEMGQTFFAANRLKDAEEMYLKAVQIGEKVSDRLLDLMTIYQNLADLYAAMGQPSRQNEYIVKRHQLAEAYGDASIVEISDRLTMLWTKYDVGLKEECRNDILSIEQFTDRFSRLADTSLPARLKAEYYWREQQLDSASYYIDMALTMAPDAFDNLNCAAKVYGSMQQYDRAIEYARKAVDAVDYFKDSNPMLVVGPHKQLGDLQQLNADYYGSLENYRSCFEASRMHISSNLLSLTARQRADFWDSNSAFYNFYLPYAAATLPYPSDINSLLYDAALFANGLLLSADNSVASLIQTASPAIKDLYRESLAKKELLKKMNDDFTQLQQNYHAAEDHDEYVNRLFEKKNIVEKYEQESENAERALMTALREAYPEQFGLKICEWTDVQRNLPARSAAIEYLDFPIDSVNNTIAALVVKAGMQRPEMRLLYRYPRAKRPSAISVYSSTTLGDSLITSLSDLLHDCSSVYFSPQGMLCTVALESLPRSESSIPADLKLYRVSSTRILTEKHHRNKKFNATLFGGLDYKMSVDSLVQDARSYPVLRNRGFVADNLFQRKASRESDAEIPELPGTLAEVRSISALLKSKKRVDPTLLIGNKGTESAFKALSGHYGSILHVSTHGFFNESTLAASEHITYEDFALEQSGLLLAGAENLYLNGKHLPDEIDDGILKSSEIARLDLSGVDLAILSACETALGNVTGNGVFGLQRGFKKAGVNTLLMSLWKVDDDATNELMTQFYTNWLSGRSKYESLELAKSHVRSRPEWRSPSFWAAFILLDALD